MATVATADVLITDLVLKPGTQSETDGGKGDGPAFLASCRQVEGRCLSSSSLMNHCLFNRSRHPHKHATASFWWAHQHAPSNLSSSTYLVREIFGTPAARVNSASAVLSLLTDLLLKKSKAIDLYLITQ